MPGRARGALDGAERLVGATSLGEDARARDELVGGERGRGLLLLEELGAGGRGRVVERVRREPSCVDGGGRVAVLRAHDAHAERARLLLESARLLVDGEHAMAQRACACRLAGLLPRLGGHEPRRGLRARPVPLGGAVERTGDERGLRAELPDRLAEERQIVLELVEARDGIGVLAEREGDARASEAHLGLVLLAGGSAAMDCSASFHLSARIASVQGSATASSRARRASPASPSSAVPASGAASGGAASLPPPEATGASRLGQPARRSASANGKRTLAPNQSSMTVKEPPPAKPVSTLMPVASSPATTRARRGSASVAR